MLTDEGYLASAAQDGLEALGLARAHRPDVILLDLMMLAMSGWEFLAEHARDPLLAQIPVIVLTAVSPNRLRTVEGAAEVILKPFEVDTLLDAVARHVAAATREDSGEYASYQS